MSERDHRIASGEPHAWRLDMQAALDGLGEKLSLEESGAGPKGETGQVEADPGAWGDVILARRDVPASYHLSVTVDDAVQSITDVIRGEDLFASTSVHRLLQHLLGLPVPAYHITGWCGMRTGASCQRVTAPPRFPPCGNRAQVRPASLRSQVWLIRLDALPQVFCNALFRISARARALRMAALISAPRMKIAAMM
jgi:hypothetical protein